MTKSETIEKSESLMNKQPDLRDFKVQKLIGKGSFGKVFLVLNKIDGKAYAMKVIRKDYMLSMDMIQSTLLEKEILMEGGHPFLVNMHFVF